MTKKPKIDKSDLWRMVQDSAAAAVKNEPFLQDLFQDCILARSALSDAVAYIMVGNEKMPGLGHSQLLHLFKECYSASPDLADMAADDLLAAYERDPSITNLHTPLLYFKGYKALQAHRIGHYLQQCGRVEMARYLQSRTSEIWQVDIHPAARVGRSVFIDHGTGVVIGETAVVGDDVSMLHAVTLGGSGKEEGDRHPKVGKGVLLGAGAKVLGNIIVGEGALVAAGSVVLAHVPEHVTVAGVPAKVVGKAGCKEPGKVMDQVVPQPPETPNGTLPSLGAAKR